MACMTCFADTEFQVFHMLKAYRRNQYEEKGKPLNRRNEQKINDEVRALLESKYAEKLKEMIQAYIRQEFPRLSDHFSIRCTLGLIEGLTIRLESEQWDRELVSDAEWGKLQSGIYGFVHHETTYEKTCYPWKQWQRTMLMELVKEE